MGAVEIEVGVGTATPGQIAAAWDDVLRLILEDSASVIGFVEAEGATPAELRDSEVEVAERSGDFGTTILITVVGGLAAHIVKGLWDDFVRPRIRERFGTEAGDESQ